MFEKYDEKQKAALSIATVAMFSFTIAVIAASIAVACIYGAGYGFALFACVALLMALYLYITASVKLYRRKKSKQRYQEILMNSAANKIHVVKGAPEPDFDFKTQYREEIANKFKNEPTAKVAPMLDFTEIKDGDDE